MHPELARKINLLLLLMVAGVMCGSLSVQFILGDLPCPLCILQRYAMIGLAMGPLLNLRFGIRPRHLSVTLMFALFGIAVSVRQVLLHIVPGTGNYGAPVFGMHLYTWSSLIFFIALVVTALLLLIENVWSPLDTPTYNDKIVHIGYGIMISITLFLAIITLLECGWRCPDNPVHYMLIQPTHFITHP
ncbi:disulfide bond formation protein B [Halodesulfovibrio spirochaetisodalis]|uniref:Disulfide bond formation protein B n=1 Tax=Halodesulfovibrio spirochaetisodalis TaxID=1560234 RepID=A0A1B7XH82_9BACT|nr:disulfide bond formation protein B [Halodesulfovibrio spirochaetisodalis]OBQ54877.1 hypothetical protein SP90_05180 [Halodesulfovibrio spirochaetisodalis]